MFTDLTKQKWKVYFKDKFWTITFESLGLGFYEIKVNGRVIQEGMHASGTWVSSRFDFRSKEHRFYISLKGAGDAFRETECLLYMDDVLVQAIEDKIW